MNHFESFEFYLAFYNIQARARFADGLYAAHSLTGQSPTDFSLDAFIKESLNALDLMSKQSFAIGLANTNTAVVAASTALRFPSLVINLGIVCERLKVVEEAVRNDLGYRRFLWVNPDRNDFIDQDELFGSAVHRAFPSARGDIREAGNCMAAECCTASVFHLMRAVEYGLRALAWDRRITLPKKKALDLATWEDLIKELEKSELAIQGYPKTLAREAQYDFYHGAMMEFRRFKNVYRNQIMHTRDSYTRGDADATLDHVRSFMQILSGRISETTRTPVVWKGSRWQS